MQKLKRNRKKNAPTVSAMHLTKGLCALYIIFIYLATVESNFRRLIFMYYVIYEVDSHQHSHHM